MLKPGNFCVMRNCCSSGNCVDCHGKTPVGKPMRVMQMGHLAQEEAERVAKNWSQYQATVEPQPQAE